MGVHRLTRKDSVYVESRVSEGKQANGEIVRLHWEDGEITSVDVYFYKGNPGEAVGGDTVNYDPDIFAGTWHERTNSWRLWDT
jgi:ribosomal protein L35AE/L33A